MKKTFKIGKLKISLLFYRRYTGRIKNEDIDITIYTFFVNFPPTIEFSWSNEINHKSSKK